MTTHQTLNDWLDTINSYVDFNGKLTIQEWFEEKYEIQEVLGVGLTSVVFKAIDTRLERIVALKIWHNFAYGLDSTILLREGKILAKLNHPNIVRVLDYGINRESNRPWTSLEYLGTRTLRDLIKEQNQNGSHLSWLEAVHLGLQAVSIVDYLHNSAKLFQLDIKPENLSLDPPSTTVKLMDLGSASAVGSRFWLRYGTPGYVAPEIFEEEITDEKCDVFALGIVMYELITGRNPLHLLQSEFMSQDASVREMAISMVMETGIRSRTENSPLFERIKGFDPELGLRPFRIPDELARLITSMCAPKPSSRPSAREVMTALMRMTDGEAKALPSIFISHSHQDKERFVLKFASELKSRGFNVWLDEWSLRVGEPFWERIGQAIDSSDFVIIILSQNSLNSHGVKEEIRTAHDYNLDRVKLLPIRIDPVDFSSMPLSLRSRHILDFVGWESNVKFNERVSKLASDIMALNGSCDRT
jgi:serine/threonine protein kinase